MKKIKKDDLNEAKRLEKINEMAIELIDTSEGVSGFQDALTILGVSFDRYQKAKRKKTSEIGQRNDNTFKDCEGEVKKGLDLFI